MFPGGRGTLGCLGQLGCCSPGWPSRAGTHWWEGGLCSLGMSCPLPLVWQAESLQVHLPTRNKPSRMLRPGPVTWRRELQQVLGFFPGHHVGQPEKQGVQALPRRCRVDAAQVSPDALHDLWHLGGQSGNGVASRPQPLPQLPLKLWPLPLLSAGFRWLLEPKRPRCAREAGREAGKERGTMPGRAQGQGHGHRPLTSVSQ